MASIDYFDPMQRRRDKALARAADDIALRSREISRVELRARNSVLAPLDIASSVSEHRSGNL